MMNTGPETYSELQDMLDRREEMQKSLRRIAQNAMVALAITQNGAVAFHLALGMQGRAPRTEVC